MQRMMIPTNEYSIEYWLSERTNILYSTAVIHWFLTDPQRLLLLLFRAMCGCSRKKTMRICGRSWSRELCSLRVRHSSLRVRSSEHCTDRCDQTTLRTAGRISRLFDHSTGRILKLEIECFFLRSYSKIFEYSTIRCITSINCTLFCQGSQDLVYLRDVTVYMRHKHCGKH